MRTPQKVTAADVGRYAGVSNATVSLVLNDVPGRYSEATAEKVRAAAAKLGYRVSGAGRALRNGRSDLIVIVIPPEGISWYLQSVIDAVGAAGRELGLSTIAWFTRHDGRHAIDDLCSLEPALIVDNLALSEDEREEIATAGIPLIPSRATLALHGAVGAGPVIAAAQLDLLGDRTIGFAYSVGATGMSRSSSERARAVTAECAARGLVAPFLLEITIDVESATSAIRSLPNERVGIACADDDVAIALLAGARRAGRRVPDDLALVGADITPIGQLQDPPLASVRVELPQGERSLLEGLRAVIDCADSSSDEIVQSVQVTRGGSV